MNKSNDFRQGLGVAFRLGTEMTVATGLGAVMGYGVDHYFGTKPWGIAVGVVLGGAAGMLNVYWAAQAMTKELENSDQEKNND
ncbi:MAG: AtpZ/AtpI family protein [Nitrospinae bacterium]|jgi:ATP synthase protein I|nr:AtpZ/AtpI family protein [Nitrospinota bacterium]MDA1109984.1 AtpZ/AtpI family protein [Nitrospinota bacterium]